MVKRLLTNKVKTVAKKVVKKVTGKKKPKLKFKKTVKKTVKKTTTVPPKKGPVADGIELRGGAKTNPSNARRTRRIAQVAKKKSLSGKEKTKAIQEAIYGGSRRGGPSRRHLSKPEIGRSFKEKQKKTVYKMLRGK